MSRTTGWAAGAVLLSVVTALPQAASAKGYADIARSTAQSHARTVSVKKHSPTQATMVRQTGHRGLWQSGWGRSSSGKKFARYLRHANSPRFENKKPVASNHMPSLNNQFAQRRHGHKKPHISHPAGKSTRGAPSQPSSPPSSKAS